MSKYETKPLSVEDRRAMNLISNSICKHFGAKSSPCCANKALSMTAQDNEENYPPEVIRTVHRNFYVDDVLKSVPNTDQAIPLASDLMKLLREGGFHLTKFASNSRELLASIPPASRANPKLDLDLDQLPLE